MALDDTPRATYGGSDDGYASRTSNRRRVLIALLVLVGIVLALLVALDVWLSTLPDNYF